MGRHREGISTTGADPGKEYAPIVLRKSPEFETAYDRELSHFIQCIQSGSQPEVTLQDACIASKIARAALESAHSGLPVNMLGFEEKGG
ncbi:Gfo/Idh/MocA family oxidoreductase [Paenibacillus sp. UASWS1643]|uniref:Gfo/Idh/MocA family oxidoreductase n=1 Tax=Paenibacillus sp. UASWS1643 TaxID=2580422 RepID=UPI00398BE3D6